MWLRFTQSWFIERLMCQVLCWVQSLQCWSRQSRSLPESSIHEYNFFTISIYCFRVDAGKRDPHPGCYFRWPGSGSPPASPLHTGQGAHNPHLGLIRGAWHHRISCSNDEFLGSEWLWGSYILEVWIEYFRVSWNIYVCAFKTFRGGEWTAKVSGPLSRSHSSLYHFVLAENSKKPKNYKFQPGFPHCYRVRLVKVGG